MTERHLTILQLNDLHGKPFNPLKESRP